MTELIVLVATAERWEAAVFLAHDAILELVVGRGGGSDEIAAVMLCGGMFSLEDRDKARRWLA